VSSNLNDGVPVTHPAYYYLYIRALGRIYFIKKEIKSPFQEVIPCLVPGVISGKKVRNNLGAGERCSLLLLVLPKDFSVYECKNI